MWQPIGEEKGTEFQYLLGLITEDRDREQVMRFVFLKDKKRALISRLLVRRASALVLGLTNFEGLQIQRTAGKKPFPERPSPRQRPDFENWNFNVAH